MSSTAVRSADLALLAPALIEAVRAEIAAGGTVEYADDHCVIFTTTTHVSHLHHAALTLVTGGLWGLFWLANHLSRRRRVHVELLADGSVRRTVRAADKIMKAGPVT